MDTRIHVRGGLYEVDINNGVVHPVYWKGGNLSPEYFSPELKLPRYQPIWTIQILIESPRLIDFRNARCDLKI